MATLKLSTPAGDSRFTLMENGEQYEQLWRFRDVDEVKAHLSRLDMSEAQLAELWAGHEVELDEGLSWPAQSASEKPRASAHPAALGQTRAEERTGRRH